MSTHAQDEPDYRYCSGYAEGSRLRQKSHNYGLGEWGEWRVILVVDTESPGAISMKLLCRKIDWLLNWYTMWRKRIHKLVKVNPELFHKKQHCWDTSFLSNYMRYRHLVCWRNEEEKQVNKSIFWGKWLFVSI